MGWRWTPRQAEILRSPTRFIQLCGGKRGGKSLFTARWMAIQLIDTFSRWVEEGEPDVEGGIVPFWFVAKSYEMCEQEFRYLERDLIRKFGRKTVQATSRAVGPNEITVDVGKVKFVVRTKSAADETTLEAEAPAAIAVCEAAQITYAAYVRLLARITQRRAPMLLSGSLENDWGWYCDLLKQWSAPVMWRKGYRSWVVETETNLFDFPLGAEDPELLQRKRELSEDDFNRYYMGRPAPPRGIVHDLFSVPVHVREVAYNAEEPVWLAVDPGITGPAGGGSAYAIECCQFIQGQVRVFDEIYVDNRVEPVILTDILMIRPWWGKAEIYGVIDRAGATRAGAHEASIEVWRETAGLNLMYTEAAIPIPDQIRRFDTFLKINELTQEPGIVFDIGCRGVISELGGGDNPLRSGVADTVYRWELLPDGSISGGRPRDRYNDAIKALTYLLIFKFGYATPQRERRVIKSKVFIQR